MAMPLHDLPTRTPAHPGRRGAGGRGRVRRADWLLTLAALAVADAWAQSPGTAAPVRSLPEVRITADPLAPDELRNTRPVGVLQSPELERRMETSLGGTLSQQPGVQSSAFGTAAGRPVIRSQDGPRVRVTQDGLDTFDVSTLSPDHATVADPLSASRVEVFRGPATLFYGGGAVGGLVNVSSERIPGERLGPLQGQALLSGDTGSQGQVAAVRARAGAGGLNWTVGVFDRRAGDYRIPGEVVAGDPDSRARRLPNSHARGDGASAGVSWVGDRLTVGVAHAVQASHYGIPSEEDVRIDLRQRRTEALMSLQRPLPGVQRIRATFAQGRYRHDEIEGSGEIGTSFRSRGREARMDIAHEPLAGIRGVLGLHSRDRRLNASGDEAYIPSARERSDAVFYVAERDVGAARLEFGARSERARVTPTDDAGATGRSFSLTALSLGASVPLGREHLLAANLSSSQRAPVIEELFAHGPHAATATYEIGDPNLRRERSLNLDVSLRKARGDTRWKIGLFANRFRNYVHGRATDENGDGIADRVDGENQIVNTAEDPHAGEFTRLAYTQARARFTGLEFELSHAFSGTPWHLRVFGDLSRGRIEGEGNAPRLAPTRVGVLLGHRSGPWSGFVSLLAVRGQNRVATLETTTPGYEKLDAEIAYDWTRTERGALTLFAQGRNLLNQTIRVHTSFVKDVVPQPGRTLMLGLRATY